MKKLEKSENVSIREKLNALADEYLDMSEKAYLEGDMHGSMHYRGIARGVMTARDIVRRKQMEVDEIKQFIEYEIERYTSLLFKAEDAMSKNLLHAKRSALLKVILDLENAEEYGLEFIKGEWK